MWLSRGRPRINEFYHMVVEEELHIPYWDTKHRDSIRSALCQHAKKQGHVYITASFDGELLIKRKK